MAREAIPDIVVVDRIRVDDEISIDEFDFEPFVLKDRDEKCGPYTKAVTIGVIDNLVIFQGVSTIILTWESFPIFCQHRSNVWLV